MKSLTIEKANRTAIDDILMFIRLLAKHEGRPEVATIDAAALESLLFGDRALADAYIGYADEQLAAFVIVAERFSSFRGTRSLYLEDMLVLDQYRGEGFGKEIFAFVASLALEGSYYSLEWSALDDNDVAIGFYDHIKAQRETGVLHFSMSASALKHYTEGQS